MMATRPATREDLDKCGLYGLDPKRCLFVYDAEETEHTPKGETIAPGNRRTEPPRERRGR